MQIQKPMCFSCKHYHLTESTPTGEKYCDAFPKGIPEDVFEEGHLDPVKGDNGIVFDRVEEDESWEMSMHVQAYMRDALKEESMALYGRDVF